MTAVSPEERSWVAALYRDAEAGLPVGSAVVIDIDRVLTCAHVVQPDSGGRSRPTAFWVAFPMVEDWSPPRVRVKDWSFADPGTDLVVLRLAGEVPDGVRPAPLVLAMGNDLRGQAWWAYGFPKGDGDGNSADGRVGEALANGKLRLDTESRYQVARGFSGAGVWVGSGNQRGVVGVVCQAHTNGDGRALGLQWANHRLPGEKLEELSRRPAASNDEVALSAWGWELAADPQLRVHWRPRARGVSREGEGGYRFRGRRAALTRIVDWLDAPAGLRVLVVTGKPGAGKSAVLGRVITTADRDLRRDLPEDDRAVKAVVGSVGCAVHAKGKTALEVAAEIARAVHRPAPARTTDLAPLVREALAERRDAEFNLVLDALDEAVTPSEARVIVKDLLLPLLPEGARVVVGTRRRDDAGDVLQVFGRRREVVDLDAPGYSTLQDLADYALATLRLTGAERPGNPYEAQVTGPPVAQRIAELADGNFLIAGLIARTYGVHDAEARTRHEVDFPSDIGLVLDYYLDPLPPVDGVSAGDVLAALAFAQTPGFTTGLWRTAIRALHGQDIAEGELAAFARSAAANFLLETGDSRGDTVYRLFHQALNDALLPDQPGTEGRAADERHLASAFLAYGAAQGWQHAPDYLLKSLPAHAARGGVGDELLADADYLLHADHHRVLTQPQLARTLGGTQRIRLLRLTPQAAPADPPTRAALFTVTETLEALGTTYRDLRQARPYQATWAAAQPRQEETTLTGHTSAVNGVCVVQIEGRSHLATAGNDGTVRIWDATTGQHRAALEGHTRRVTSVCGVHLEGRPYLASAGEDGTVRIWDATMGQHRTTLEGHTREVFSVCAVQIEDRPYLATAGEGGAVRIWDATTGGVRATLEGHSRRVVGVCAVQIEGRPYLATAGDDGAVRIWDAATGGHRVTLAGHTGTVRSVCVVQIEDHPYLATAGDDGAVRIWDAATGGHRATLAGHTGTVRSVCVVQIEGRPYLATAGDDGTVRIWDATTGRHRTTLEGHTDQVVGVCAVQIAGRPHLATAGGFDRTVRIWDATTSQHRNTQTGHTRGAIKVCVVQLDDGPHFAGTSADGTVRIWDAVTGGHRTTLEGHTDTAIGVCVVQLAGRPHLASTSADRTVRIWDAVTGRHRTTLNGHTEQVNDVCAVQIEGRPHLASASIDGTVRIWDATTGRHRTTLQGHTERLFGVCVVQLEGRPHLASTGGDRTVRIWDATTGRHRATLTGHTSWVNDVCAVQVDGRPHLASAGHGTVRIWDATTGQHRTTLTGHSDVVNGMCVVQLGGRPHLASTGFDHTVRIWDVEREACVRIVPVHHYGGALAWDGHRLAIALPTGVLVITFPPPS